MWGVALAKNNSDRFVFTPRPLRTSAHTRRWRRCLEAINERGRIRADRDKCARARNCRDRVFAFLFASSGIRRTLTTGENVCTCTGNGCISIERKQTRRKNGESRKSSVPPSMNRGAIPTRISIEKTVHRNARTLYNEHRTIEPRGRDCNAFSKRRIAFSGDGKYTLYFVGRNVVIYTASHAFISQFAGSFVRRFAVAINKYVRNGNRN